MVLSHLEVENFKSYGGFQRIGPFKNFTSIIGPNGSGKSNLMDAMSFVLGVNSRDLRSSQLRDLVHRPPGDTDHLNLSCRVTVVYVGKPAKLSSGGDDDSEESEAEDASRKETRFSRSVNGKSGSSSYSVNGRTMPWAEYESALASIGVLVKARNFLVFQGDVETIARKTPKELVNMFEHISASADLRKDYDEANKAREEAEGETVHAFHKQRGYKAERKELRGQVEEAARFDAALVSRAAEKREFFMWQLYHVGEDISGRETAADDLEKEREGTEAEERKAESVLKEAKKGMNRRRRDVAAKEKKRVQLAGSVDALHPDSIQASETLKSLKKQLSGDEKAFAKQKAAASKHGDALEKIVEEMAELTSREKLLLRQYEEETAAAGGTVLTEEQEAKYAEVREAAAVASAPVRQRLDKVLRTLENARAREREKGREHGEIDRVVAEAKKGVEEWRERRGTLTAAAEKAEAELVEKRVELAELQERRKGASERREAIDQELQKLNMSLREHKDEGRRRRDDERLLSAIGALQRHFPGVQGRLVDLCRPTQRRYSLAVTVAGGKHMDAIVVDTKATGFECIKYLKEQRVGTATFIPLDSIKVPEQFSPERTRTIEADGRYRLCADVIECEDSVRRAVLYAVGNTVVCQDLDAARELCFGDGQGGNRRPKIKAVTVTGGVISKAGTMTGGLTQEDSRRAGRWGDIDVEKLRARKEELETERQQLEVTLGAASRGGAAGAAEEMQGRVDNLTNRIEYTRADLGYTEEKLKEQEALIKKHSKRATTLKKALDRAEADAASALANAEEARTKVRTAEDEYYLPFQEETGLKDVRSFHQSTGAAREEFMEERRKVREALTKLEAQKSYEERRDLKVPVEEAEKRITERKREMKQAEKNETKLKQKIEEAKVALGLAVEAVQGVQTLEKEAESEVATAQSVLKKAHAQSVLVTKSIHTERSTLERLRLRLHETLQKARVEEVELPLVSRSGSRSQSQRTSEEEEDDSNSQMTDDNTASGTVFTQETMATAHFSQRDDPRLVKDRQDAEKVEFRSLSAELKERRTDREEKKLRNKFDTKIAKLTAQIESMAPNMKANEAFESVSQRLKDSGVDFDEAKTRAREATKHFNELRTLRANRFNDAFNHIGSALKTIYRDLTKSSKHPLGGTAYLSLDDTNEPYTGGMKFNAMPPMKRFRDMEALSGGEKTVAALALLFAIHSYRPAPFFVMDEVDAALDNVNVLKVCNYIRQRSGDFQCIVISLKDMFYEQSESLVGICKDVGTMSSKSLTLDLGRYDEDREEKEEEVFVDTPKRRKRFHD